MLHTVRVTIWVLLGFSAVLSPHLLLSQNAADAKRSVTNVPVETATQKLGPYFALIIGNDIYKPPLHTLGTPVNDATELASVLSEQYGFKTKVLSNATRADIFAVLDEYRRMPPTSNLLIYYAGHGKKDDVTGMAYWLPTDSQLNNSSNWISADDIRNNFLALPALHVLIISDSCYSGVLEKSMSSSSLNLSDAERANYLNKLMRLKSRSILSSGGDEPVPDSGGDGNHSYFSAVLLRTLREIPKDRFNGRALFDQIQAKVAANAPQLPKYSVVLFSEDNNGDFIFARPQGAHSGTADCCKPDRSNDETAQVSPELSVPVFENTIMSLLTQYKTAYESGDIANLQRLWPGLSQQQVRNLRTFFGAAHDVHLEFKVIEASEGENHQGKVLFAQKVSYSTGGSVKQVSTSKVTMNLIQVPARGPDGIWQINSIRH